MSKYPNLIAEYKATGYHITTLAEHTNVTVEVMRDILTGKDSASYLEAVAMTKLFSCSFEYLFSDTLTIIKNEENRISEYKAHSEKLFRELEDMNLLTDTYTRHTINKALRFLKNPTITQAELNEAKSCIEHIEYAINKAKKPVRCVSLKEVS